ncbi:hypothetical protein DKT69_16440 [Micromonospora sicca]|uniref:Uncharacterized protein n=1 Tax=Micromonospora sicca TaxID=2202420 RepID=A0A317DI07_9ACTN|nr:hypothetical protein DKT69_16440 [Micromonospora sp. 4G51]
MRYGEGGEHGERAGGAELWEGGAGSDDVGEDGGDVGGEDGLQEQGQGAGADEEGAGEVADAQPDTG